MRGRGEIAGKEGGRDEGLEGGRKVRWEVDRNGSRRGKGEKGERTGEGAPFFFWGWEIWGGREARVQS